MPLMPQSSAAVDTIVLPKSGVSITLRRHATGRDRQEALAVAIRLRQAGFESSHVYMRYLCAIAANLIVEWDATVLVDGNERLVPISPQSLAAMESEEDYEFLINDVAKRVTLRGEQDAENFTQPSTPSSEDTSSPIPESSPSS